MYYPRARASSSETFPTWSRRRSEASANAKATAGLASNTLEDGVYGLVWWKRTIDIVFSTMALLASLPFMVIVAVLIKTTSQGPVLYTQERVGLNRRTGHRRRVKQNPKLGLDPGRPERRAQTGFGKPFTMYKFRTMTVQAENGKPEWSTPGDPRITALGRFLRKSRLDEVPQFVNVLRGDMSVVGPRPERAYFLAEAEGAMPQFKLRLRAKPGITGLAQVEHGYTNTLTGLHGKLVFDLEYINTLCLRTDLKILLRTVAVVLTGRGAY